MGEQLYPKLEDLVARMRATGEFAEQFLTAEILRRQVLADRAVILPKPPNKYCTASGPILAHVARRKTRDPTVQELAQVFVDPALGSNGVMRCIVAQLIATTPPNIRLFAITKRLGVGSVLISYDFRPVTKRVMGVEEWRARVGLGDRLPDSALPRSHPNPRDGERWLYLQF
jgi:hypothetical protein